MSFDLLRASCWLAGATANNSSANVRRATHDNPQFTSLVVALIRSVANDFSFNSVAIFDNLRTPPHVDERNDEHAYNLVMPLSRFSGGNIVVRRPQDLLSLEVAAGPVAFQAAKRQHWVAPWSGRRTVLVAFTSKVCPPSPEDACFLTDLGFPLPLGPLDPCQPSPLPEPPRQLPKSPPSNARPRPWRPQTPNQLMQRKQPVPTQQVPVPRASHAGLSSSRSVQDARGCLMSCVLITFRLTPLTAPEISARSCAPVSAWISLTLLNRRSAANLFRQPDHLQPCAWACHAGRAPARARALPRHLRGKFHRPMRLRSSRFPLGIPTLRGANAQRVRSANLLYRFALSLLPDLLDAGVRVSVENP